MLKIELDIIHPGCWGSEINLRFPSLKFSSIDCRWVMGQVAHIILAVGDQKYFDKIIKYLKGKRDVSSIEVLSRGETALCLRTLTKHSKKHEKFSHIFFQNNCFPIAPTRFVKQYEVWTLGTAEKKNITEVYNLLKKKYSVKIRYIKEETIESKLTNKQREALMYAEHWGYYEWPRKKSITEICKLLKIPKTVFLSHLRKAENKIINDYFLSK